ncbi:hypothetical protein IFR05_017454, partial [Cadophora sp. M221]
LPSFIWYDAFSKPGTWPPLGLQLLEGLDEKVYTCAENQSINRTITDFKQRSCDDSLQEFLTDRRGYGLKTKRKINVDEHIIEYKGEPITEAEMLAKGGRNISYIFAVGQPVEKPYLDARHKGNKARFLNHRCGHGPKGPNCQMERWVVDNCARLILVAKRDIEIDEELTINYDAAFEDECWCGSPMCVSTNGKNEA